MPVFAQPACKTQCAKIEQERKDRQSAGFQYVSPQDIAAKKPMLFIQVQPDLAAGAPAVDDELYLQDVREDNTTNRLWTATLQNSRSPLPMTLTADQMTPGEHLIQLWYADTQPPDAHFFADLCGFVFFGQPNTCITYREGKTFGTGIVRNGIRVIVKATKVYVSRLNLPKSCTCE